MDLLTISPAIQRSVDGLRRRETKNVIDESTIGEFRGGSQKPKKGKKKKIKARDVIYGNTPV